MTHHDIILRPVMTEKTSRLSRDNKVVFRVNQDANKYQIRAAVEALFDVKVTGVNTIRVPGKTRRAGRRLGRQQGFKKAIITLADGEVISLFQDELSDEEIAFGDEDFDFGDEEADDDEDK
jgi:large subunit ribosomal protein L23